MDQGGEKRREPTMADLEAFERLLRDSLHGDTRSGEPRLAQPEQTRPGAYRGDDALAELSRLVEAPLELKIPELSIPGMPETEKAMQQMHAVVGPPPVEDKPIVIPPPPQPLSLDEFEAELRRFEAIPASETAIPFPEFQTPEPLRAETFETQHAYAPASAASHFQPEAPQPQAYDDWQPEPFQAPYDPQAEYDAEDAAYAQAAAVAAAAAAAAAARQRRSRVIFYSLGGLAALGATALGASYLFSGKPGKPIAQRDVPVVVAKTDPTKERPANPGGVEIPDQNKQILAPKAAVETKPAQVVTTTEQPLDLNQVARRDGVRVIAPSPFQGGTQPTPETPAASPPPGEPRRVQSVRLNDPVSPATTPSPGPSTMPPAGTVTPSGSTMPAGSPGIGAGAISAAGVGGIAAIAAGNLARPGAAQPSAAAPAPVPPPQPRVSAVVPPTAVTPQQPVKVESRPVTAQRPSANPAAAPSVPSVPRQPPAARPGNAPLNLTNPQPQRNAAAPTAQPAAPRQAPVAATTPAPRPAATNTGGSGFAVQLASRPTESDARGAVGSLASRYAGPLGGRAATVVSGQANGQTVYRVRVNGFSQSDASQACEKIKAAGGGCFVTRQ